MIDSLVLGAVLGCIYGLVALSFNLMAKATGVLNFAQGILLSLGALTGAIVMSAFGVPWVIALVITVTVTAVLGVLIEEIAVTPVLRARPDSPGWVITTLALLLIGRSALSLIFGVQLYSVNPPFDLSTSPLSGLSVRLSSYDIFVVVCAFVLVAAVEILYRTRFGKAVRAVAEDREAAQLRGINPRLVALVSFAAGGAACGIVGLLAAPISLASTTLGVGLMIRGFEAVVVGGVGSSWGGLLGGIGLGLVEAWGASMYSPSTSDLLLLIVVLIVLFARPNGLFGHGVARQA